MAYLVFKNFSIISMNQANAYLSKVNSQSKVWNMFTANNKDIRTTPLISLMLNIVNIDILNIEQLSHLIILLKQLTDFNQLISSWDEWYHKQKLSK